MLLLSLWAHRPPTHSHRAPCHGRRHFYLDYIVHPESPTYTIDRIAVKQMNLSSPFSSISPEFDVSIKADNGNHKLGIYYENDSSVEIFYRDVSLCSLCNGVLLAFYQPSNNMMVFHSALKGNDVELAETDRRALMNVVAKRGCL